MFRGRPWKIIMSNGKIMEHHLLVPVADLSAESTEHNSERSPQVIVLSLF